ncbi:Phosphoglycolate phosphatase [Streptomyces sp. RB5]|uniref:Phosphoglycolate phosphatase n=1 Tax=Streptomyces smaragdinus TaxID=2585196 RepID=A0A7K0CPP0_9ACTN|nr:Phosphoglycolate phosphatase [Streptomyces smaragdinus]
MFDLDGTLVDTMPVIVGGYAATVRELGGPEVGRAEILGAFPLGTAAVVLAHFLGRPVTEAELARHRAGIRERVTSVEAFPGVPEMLDTLRTDGAVLAVYTGASRVGAERSLTMSGLAPYFPVLVTGEEVARQKPAADGLRQACAALGTDAARAAYVGDTEADLGCATAAGARPVHAAWDAAAAVVPGHVRAEHPREVPGLVLGG